MSLEPNALENPDIGRPPGGKGLDIDFDCSRNFVKWLKLNDVSIMFSTYQSGKIFFIGHNPDNTLSIFERTFNRCMGMYADPNTIYLSTLYQLWRFENVLGKDQDYNGFDKLYVPQMAYTTGDLDGHDVAIDEHGQPIFINTLYSCIATVSDSHSFRPIWQPKFISKLTPEDRCHLNGLAMENGKPRFVTAVAATDIYDGWREHRAGGGIVIDVDSNEIVCEGLSMPHSPRLYQDKLWLTNSGTGEFGFIDVNKGSSKFEAVAFCPGYARGVSFVNNYVIIGLSQPRDKTFTGLPLQDNISEKNISPRCGMQIIDINTGDCVHHMTFNTIIKELYDVVLVPGVKKPMAIGMVNDEIHNIITIQNLAS